MGLRAKPLSTFASLLARTQTVALAMATFALACNGSGSARSVAKKPAPLEVAAPVTPAGATAVTPVSPTTSAPVLLNTSLSQSKLLVGGDGRAYMDIELEGVTPKERSRPRVSAALVIDRSGSMAGTKLTQAKLAARRFIDRLANGDRVALVTYGTDVTVLARSTTLNSDSRSRLRRLIDRISDDGNTNLSGGMLAGRDELRRVLDEAGVARVLLISDGLANEGITSAADLADLSAGSARAGIPISTIGVGLDFDEDVMRQIAERGAGMYHYIRDAEALASILDSELDSMSAAVAKQVEVRIALGVGVTVEQVFGYPYETQGSDLVIRVPDLHAGQRTKIVAKLLIPTDESGTRPVADVRLRYVNPTTARQGEDLRSKLNVALTNDAQAVQLSVNRTVMERVDEVKTADTLDKAMKAYAQGDTVAAEKMIDVQAEETERTGAAFGSGKMSTRAAKMKELRKNIMVAPASSAAGADYTKSGKAEAFDLAR